MVPLRIAIQVDELFGRIPGGGGQGRVITNLLSQLGGIDGENQYTLFSVRPPRGQLIEPNSLPKNFRLVGITSLLRPESVYLSWHLLRWPSIERMIGSQDVVHATSSSVLPAVSQARLLVTVHDLVWWRMPGGLKWAGRFFHQTGLRIALREADMVVTVSDATRRDVLEYNGKGNRVPRIATIPIAADPSFGDPFQPEAFQRLAARLGLPSQYIVTVGTVEPRKNLPRLLEAYALLEPELQTQQGLVIVGPFGWKMPAMDEMIRAHAFHGRVLWTDWLNDEDLKMVIRGASALVYPSLMEGFGIPLLEAMWCDLPVVTSRCSSMPEVVGDAAVLVEPTSVTSIADGMRAVLSDPLLRRGLVEKGRLQREKYSFRRMAEQYLAAYREVSKTRSQARRG